MFAQRNICYDFFGRGGVNAKDIKNIQDSLNIHNGNTPLDVSTIHRNYNKPNLEICWSPDKDNF